MNDPEADKKIKNIRNFIQPQINLITYSVHCVALYTQEFITYKDQNKLECFSHT
jgi:hypothetical protein